MAALAAERIEQLRGAFSGDVLTPSEPAYDEARRIHNGLIDKRPAVIARCLTTADVVDAVNFGRQEGLELSVRGGGHSVAGKSVTDGGLMIDLAQMKGIHVDPERRTARAQGGVTWAEYNRATAAFGLATTGGVVSTTGIAGLTLGGGLGWLMGKYGIASDNLVSAEVVLASGEIVTASDDTDPDLFWAIRGGGGNFGVVTSFKYLAYPLSSALAGIVAHPLSSASEVFGVFRDIAAQFPDELTGQLALVHAPDGSGTKVCGVALCHIGEDQDRAEADVLPIREFGPPILDSIGRIPYTVVNTLLDGMFPRGALNYWKASFLLSLSDEATEKMVKAFEKAPTPMCGMVLEHFHGAFTRVAPSATAYPHREPGYNLVIAGEWIDARQTDSCIAWVRETFDSLRPQMADWGYVNYLAAEEQDRVQKAYGGNYDRLVQLKRRYDPDNLFRLNQNIDPQG